MHTYEQPASTATNTAHIFHTRAAEVWEYVSWFTKLYNFKMGTIANYALAAKEKNVLFGGTDYGMDQVIAGVLGMGKWIL